MTIVLDVAQTVLHKFIPPVSDPDFGRDDLGNGWESGSRRPVRLLGAVTDDGESQKKAGNDLSQSEGNKRIYSRFSPLDVR